MNRIFSMAIKDLKILMRDRVGAFFIIGFPIVMGLFFGAMYGGMGNQGSRSAMKIAIVDQDNSEFSKKFIEGLSANENLKLEPAELAVAKDSVRKGRRTGVLVIPEGFGKTAGIFWEEQPEIELGMDPSRTAEAAMMQGFVMEAVGQLAGERFADVNQFRPSIDDAKEQIKSDKSMNMVNRQMMLTFLGSVDSMFDSMNSLQSTETESGETLDPLGGGGGFQFANVKSLDVTRELDPKSNAAQLKKVTTGKDLSFPQAMMWGVLSCVAGFAISIARERTLGTLVRLQVAPVSRFHILAGKALACFLAVIGVVVMMTVLGVILGMNPGSYPKLVLATLCVAFCFVGIMMTLSVLGKTEQSVSGSGWAVNMVMAMFGGCMIPVMFMPKFIQSLSVLSPVKWGILSIEGAIWRGFSYEEMLLPCVVLIGFGIAGLTVGTVILKKRT